MAGRMARQVAGRMAEGMIVVGAAGCTKPRTCFTAKLNINKLALFLHNRMVTSFMITHMKCMSYIYHVDGVVYDLTCTVAHSKLFCVHSSST